MRSSSLRTRLIAGLLTIGALFTLISTGVQLRSDYYQAQTEAATEFDIARRYALPLLHQALQNSQPELLHTTLQGMLTLPAIHRVVLQERTETLAAVGPAHTPKNDFTRQYGFTVGERDLTLLMQTDLTRLHKRLYARAGPVLLSNALRTLVVTLFVAFFIDRLVMRHIRRVASHLTGNPPGSPRKSLSLKRAAYSQRDELDELVSAVNEMQCALLRYESTLEEEKGHYTALVENNPEAIWRCELNEPLHRRWSAEHQLSHLTSHCRVVEANRAAQEYAVAGHPPHDADLQLSFLHEGLWSALVNGQGQVKNLLINCPSRAGGVRHLSHSVAAIFEGEVCHTIWGISIDITPRIQAQQALQEREKQLQESKQSLADAQALAHMGHWEYITEQDKLTVSDEFARIYGFTFQDAPPKWKDLIERIHPDDRNYVIDTLSRVDRHAAGAEHRIIWPNGEERCVQAVARKQIDASRVEATFGIIIDITDRRRAEQAREHSQRALAESEARMAEAQAIAHMGHWMMNYRDKSFSCSDEFYRIYGHQPGSFPADVRKFYKQIHPDDRKRIFDLLSEVRRRPISDYYRIIRPDGQIRYLRGTAKPFYSGGKLVERVFGISVDVTEQVHAEQALQTSQQLLGTAFELCPDGIAFLDLQGLHTLAANPAFTQITGYSEDELKHHGIEMLQALFACDASTEMALEHALVEYEQADETPLRLTDRQGNVHYCGISWRSIFVQNREQKLVFLRNTVSARTPVPETHAAHP